MANENSDITFLMDIYQKYLNAAIAAESAKNIELAKRNYYLAADTLIKIAQNTTGKLKDARISKVKSLTSHADSLMVQKKAKPSDNHNNTSDDEAAKKWEAAKIPNIRFSDVIGLEDVKREIIMKMINPIKYPEKYKLYKKKTGGGVILYGPPGTGKTMIAKAIACEVGAHFYAIKSSDIVSKWVGDSEKNIASLFEEANKQDRSIIFIDEMDSLFKQRGEDTHNDKRVNEFLQQIDGFASKNENLLVLGASNRPWDIDNAAMRSGRFSEKIYIHLPDQTAREGLFKIYLKDIPVDQDVNIKELARICEGFSGADIMEVVEKAKEIPLEYYIKTDNALPVNQKNLLFAIKHVAKNIDNSTVPLFEAYAKRNNGLLNFDNNEKEEKEIKIDESISLHQDKVEIEFDETEFTFVQDKKYSLEFYLSSKVEKVYLKIDTKNLSCTKKIRNWKTSQFTIDKEGTYIAEIFDGNTNKKIGEKEIKFSSGIEEIDMGV